ncbi:MAG: hypothetical protein ACO1SX_22170 [Actinomycetota bacterium]
MTSSSTVAAVLRSSRREALFVAVVWVLACGYTVGYSAMFGYGQTDAPTLIWGIPSWVLLGILLPWSVTSLVTCWFAFFGMKDEDLGEQMAPPTGEGARDE